MFSVQQDGAICAHGDAEIGNSAVYDAAGYLQRPPSGFQLSLESLLELHAVGLEQERLFLKPQKEGLSGSVQHCLHIFPVRHADKPLIDISGNSRRNAAA